MCSGNYSRSRKGRRSVEEAEITFKTTKSHIVCEAKVRGIDPGAFQTHATTAKVNCPVSQALAGTEITLEAALAG
jgi:osmotically inducible protein OsmC